MFQLAAINKPLVSLGKLVDDGHSVIFDGIESYILRKKSGKRIKLKRERGVFVIDAYADPEQGGSDFSRRGQVRGRVL